MNFDEAWIDCGDRGRVCQTCVDDSDYSWAGGNRYWISDDPDWDDSNDPD